MIVSTTEKKSVISLILISSLFLLTGCLGEKEKAGKSDNQVTESQSSSAGKGDVLLSIDGKPVLYAQDFEEQKAMAQQGNQQLNMILQMMPDAEYKMLFKSIEATYVMKEWVVRQSLDQDPKFIKQMDQILEQVKLQMYIRLYQDAHPVKVSDHEARKYYEEKKDQIPGLILSPAGVEIVYASFDSKGKAESFVAKVKDGSEKHFKSAAKDGDVKIENMLVSAETAVSDALRNSVLAVTKFPSKEVVKIDDNTYWVVGMLKKQEAQYRSFETPEIKQGITKMCKDEKQEAELTKQIEQLSKEFNVVENTAYFENKMQNHTRALKKAEEIAMQAQQQALENVDQDTDILDDKM